MSELPLPILVSKAIPPPTPPTTPFLRNAASAALMASAGLWSKAVLYLYQKRITVHGLPEFLSLLDARRAGIETRGLLTVSNHISVIDDPVIWGVLPIRYFVPPQHLRHSLGSADICFKNPLSSAFFSLGQVHPTYRLHKSPSQGGLWQPTISALPAWMDSGRWVHIFPEGRVHQHPRREMRYFKWGVARALLESETAPVVVPIFVQGMEGVMPENREWPRWWVRGGQEVVVTFGGAVDGEKGWGDLRARWRKVVEAGGDLRNGDEAVRLRVEATRRVRDAVAGVRRGLGLPEEDPSAGDVEWYKNPGMDKKNGTLADGTEVKDT